MEHTFWQFIWGISEDDKLVYEGQVLYSENLDLTSNSDYITLSPKPSLHATLDEEPQAMYYLKRGKNVLITSLDNKKVFRWWTHVFTASYDIRVFWANSEYLFWYDYSEDIHYLPLANVSDADWTPNVWDGVQNLPSNVNSFPFVVMTNNDFSYLAHGTTIFKINHSTTPADTGQLIDTFEFPYDTISGITVIAWQIKIFQEDGMVFLWDWESEAPSQAVDLGTDVDLVQQFWNREFLVWDNTLYELDGFTLIKIASSFNSDKMQLPKMDIRVRMAQVVWNLKQMTYISWESIGQIEDPTSTYEFWVNSPVITYWEKKSWFPIAMNNWITNSSQEVWYDTVYWIVTWWGYLYIAYEDQNWNFYIDSVDLDRQDIQTQEWTGLLVFPTFDWGNKTLEKRLEKISIRADFGSENWKLVVFDLQDWELVPIDTDIATSTIEKEWEWEWEMVINKDFYDITPAIVFDQDNDYYKNNGAMKFYYIKLHYGPIKQ